MQSAAEIEDRLSHVWSNHPEIQFAYLFGSAAESSVAQPHDIDIAVYAEAQGETRVDWITGLHGDLCDALHTNAVDLIHLNVTDNIMLLDEIVRKGRVIRGGDSEIRKFFEAGIWHRAIDFKEKRMRCMGV